MAERAAEIVIRQLVRRDAPLLAALEARCQGAASWGERGYQNIGTGGITGWTAELGKTLVGFILTRAVADEMEILNLAVDPDARRERIGARLVAQAVQEGRRTGIKRIYLEVRESNAAARALYLVAGFALRGRRKSYYSQPAEDALVLAFSLD